MQGRVAWVLAALVLTASCGTSSGQGFTASGPVEAAAATPTVVRTPVELPDELTVNFPGYSGDGAAGVRAFGEFWRAYWVAAAGGSGMYTDYLDLGDPYGDTKDFVSSVAKWTASGKRPTGVVKAHKLSVLSATPSRVALVVCADESGVRTGKNSRYKMRIVMTLSDRWRVSRFMSLPAKECG